MKSEGLCCLNCCVLWKRLELLTHHSLDYIWRRCVQCIFSTPLTFLEHNFKVQRNEPFSYVLLICASLLFHKPAVCMQFLCIHSQIKLSLLIEKQLASKTLQNNSRNMALTKALLQRLNCRYFKEMVNTASSSIVIL